MRRPDNTIIYTYLQSAPEYTGRDTLVYAIEDGGRNVGVASVVVNVACPHCSRGRTLTLAWDPNPESVYGYVVYYGPTADTTILQLSDLPLSDLNPSAPAVSSMTSWSQARGRDLL